MKFKNIAIAGAGGIGAYLAQFLFDYGVNRNQFPEWVSEWKVDLYDDDCVDVGNMLHQNFKEEDIGKPKAEIVAARCLGFMNPHLRFMTSEDFPNYDVIFSCVDSMKFRKQLYEYGFTNKKLFWIDGRCNSRNIGVYSSAVSQETLEANLSDSEERGGCLRMIDKTNKVSHTTPVVVASMMAQLFLNYYRDELVADEINMYI